MTRKSRQPARAATNPGYSRVHDSRRSRYERLYFGVAATPWPVRPVMLLALNGSIRLCITSSIYVRPKQPVKVCSDPDDDIFLECAQAAQAEYLVTRNLKHFPSLWIGTRIVSPRRLADYLSLATLPEEKA